jgi:hypothetical protein
MFQLGLFHRLVINLGYTLKVLLPFFFIDKYLNGNKKGRHRRVSLEFPRQEKIV